VFSDSWSCFWGNPDNASISNNVIRDSKIGGLFTTAYYNPSYVYNKSFHNSATTDLATSTIQLLSGSATMEFHYNDVVRSTATGAAVRSDCQSSDASTCTFENNVIEDTNADQTMSWF
jgi:Right handed beta helix region